MQFLCESDYAPRMQGEVKDALLRAKKEYRVRLRDGAELHVLRYEPKQPRGSVVILHGFGETAEKYPELCYYFLKSDLTVLIFDQRGHGRSTRVVEGNLIYVRRFGEYAEDLGDLLARERATLPSPCYLFAHSMGGAVAALYLQRADHGFSRAVLSSPMIAMQYKKVPRFLGYALSVPASLIGRAKRRFPFIGDAPSPERESFAGSGAVSSARFEAYRERKRSDARLHACATTNGWMWQALACTRRILGRGRPESIRIPVRIYAAEQESLVLESAQRKFAARLPHGEFVRVKGAKHEIFFSADDVAHPYFAEVLAFFEHKEK